jgi:hypothetical protein
VSKPVEFRTRDGQRIHPGDTVYHPLYFPVGIVQADGTAKIPMYAIVPVGECYSNRDGKSQLGERAVSSSGSESKGL